MHYFWERQLWNAQDNINPHSFPFPNLYELARRERSNRRRKKTQIAFDKTMDILPQTCQYFAVAKLKEIS
jgi:hypothetical protein